jgi:CheY-like chemotaxis protein
MKKVLLVSASKPFLARNVTLLGKKGFHFFTASSGTEALALHREHAFDLILSDLDLHDMDGALFCREVRAVDGPHVVPVVLICYDTVESIEKAKLSDASALLLRPINPTHLLITIGSFIDMQLARDRRVVFRAPVLCRAAGEEFLGRSEDISVTGMLMEIENLLEIGSRITCHFTLADKSRLQPEAEVIRGYRTSGGKKRFGIKFIGLAQASRNAIERYIVSNDHLGVKQTPYRPLEKSAYYEVFRN